MLKIKEIRLYCNQKLPRQATGTRSACPDHLIGLDLITLIETIKNSIRTRRVGLDRSEPEENFKETSPRFSEWNHCGSLARLGSTQALGPGIDEIGLLRGIPPKNIVFGNIFVGFKDELDAHHEFICGMYPFD
jgi:hypothetical protein